jgi:hypothetical protein
MRLPVSVEQQNIPPSHPLVEIDTVFEKSLESGQFSKY